MTGFNALNYWSSAADNLLVGRFIGPVQLAFYARAFNVMTIPVMLVSTITSRVMFPTLSRIQTDHERIRRIYLQSLGLLGLLAFPAVVGLFIVTRPFVLAVYGDHWEPVVPLLQILCGAALLRCFFQATGWIFTSQGRADLLLRLSVVWSIGVVAAFVIGLHWGTTGVAAAYTCCNALVAVPAFALSGRLIGVSLAEVGRSLVGAACATAVMGVAVWLLELAVRPHLGNVGQLLTGLLAGIAVYGIVLHVGSPRAYADLRRLLSGFRRTRGLAPR
jgi:PST family polysaccharide transporter